MPDKLSIKIWGHAGTGKSTVARIIQNCLLEKGLIVTLDDISADCPNLDLRVEAMRNKKTEINISTLRLNKSALKPSPKKGKVSVKVLKQRLAAAQAKNLRFSVQETKPVTSPT